MSQKAPSAIRCIKTNEGENIMDIYAATSERTKRHKVH